MATLGGYPRRTTAPPGGPLDSGLDKSTVIFVPVVPPGQNVIEPLANFDFELKGKFDCKAVTIAIGPGISFDVFFNGARVIHSILGYGFSGDQNVFSEAFGVFLKLEQIRITGTNMDPDLVSEVGLWIIAVV